MFITNTLKIQLPAERKSLQTQVSVRFLLQNVSQNRACLNQNDSQNEEATWQFN